MKKILCILGHPDINSLCATLHNTYVQSAKESGHDVIEIKLIDLEFDPILRNGYKKIQELEPDLIKAQKYILWADHIVFTYPYWWGSFPALLKGFIDRVFLPGFAFKYKSKVSWEKYLKTKTSRLIITADTPKFILLTFLRSGIDVMKNSILEFTGIKTKVTIISPTKLMNNKVINLKINQIKKLGSRGE